MHTGSYMLASYARLTAYALRTHGFTFVSDCVSDKGGQSILWCKQDLASQTGILLRTKLGPA